jgi:hypothetical protein|tara:strand:+ start:383 stop:634 length:252 start_codon:yes stop_codon:yes gene_type:complete
MYGVDEDKVRTKSITKDGVTKELKVITAENGYIVCITTSSMEGEEYKVEKKHWISKSDPIPDKSEKEAKEPETVAQAIKNINL